MDGDAPKRTPSAARVGAKRAFMERLDTKLAVAGYPVRPPVPAQPPPSPPPALTFEAWAELSARYSDGPPAGPGRGAPREGSRRSDAWKRFDDAYRRVLSDEDVRAGAAGERPAILRGQAHKEEQARRTGAPAGETPPAVLAPAPADLRGTNGAPDLPAAMLAAMGRMPFVPAVPVPAPAPVAPGKRSPKTVESKAMPRPVGGETMDLDAALQRPTPNLPFAGTAGDVGAVYVSPLDARQYVALRAELALRVASRKETLKRYYLPNEAAYRALEEEWRQPGRRAELVTALADFAIALRDQVLG